MNSFVQLWISYLIIVTYSCASFVDNHISHNDSISKGGDGYSPPVASTENFRDLSSPEINNDNYQIIGTKPVTLEMKEKIEATLQTFANKKQYKDTSSFSQIHNNESIVTIPVYWHVFLDDESSSSSASNNNNNNNAQGNITDERIHKQIEILNDAFAGIPSKFDSCSSFQYDLDSLVKSPFVFEIKEITRIQDSWAFQMNTMYSLRKRKELRRGSCSDLNIYSGDFFFMGNADHPWNCSTIESDPRREDAVLIHHDIVIDSQSNKFPNYQQGDTLIQLVGTWMGLYQTFENGCMDGDYVLDTPAQDIPDFECNVGIDTCAGSTGRDPIHNFMGASIDCCRYQFTLGQVRRMMIVMEVYRNTSFFNISLPEDVPPISCKFPMDGFDYNSSGCQVADLCRVGNGFCDSDIVSRYNTPECNFDGRDCLCEFPDDGFDYSECEVNSPCRIGDGICDTSRYYDTNELGPYYSTECNFDGGDCDSTCDFPLDGFNYSKCDSIYACFVADGRCDSMVDIEACNFDGLDCAPLTRLRQRIAFLLQLPIRALSFVLFYLFGGWDFL